ncbi:hypothetical protein [Nocardia rhamnosiphila]
MTRAVELVEAAANEVSKTQDGEPWDSGWSNQEYRRSPSAAFASQEGALKLSPGGVSSLEELHQMLSKHQRVKQAWDLDDLWGVLVSLIGHCHATNQPTEMVSAYVDSIVNAEPSLIVFPVANIAWRGDPIRIGKNNLLGILNNDFAGAVESLGGRAIGSKELVEIYISTLQHRKPRVGFATLTKGQGDLANAQAHRNLEQVVDLCMLLLKDKGSRNLWSLRGATNRPGARGVALDWSALNDSLEESGDQVELYSLPLHIDAVGARAQSSWLGEKPIPLWDLLNDSELFNAVELVLNNDNTILRRLYVAARWFADSYWSLAEDDSLLAAGVALDALVGAKSGLPGRAMKERFALLEQDASLRADKAKSYEIMYSLRSKVAHGSDIREQAAGSAVRKMQESITWAAWRVIDMYQSFSTVTDEDLDSVFDELKWGTRQWPATNS